MGLDDIIGLLRSVCERLPSVVPKLVPTILHMHIIFACSNVVGVSLALLVAAAVEVAVSSKLVPSDGVPENWPLMTSREKRRMWLKRREMGQFFFRTEFKGLVCQVCQPVWHRARSTGG